MEKKAVLVGIVVMSIGLMGFASYASDKTDILPLLETVESLDFLDNANLSMADKQAALLDLLIAAQRELKLIEQEPENAEKAKKQQEIQKKITILKGKLGGGYHTYSLGERVREFLTCYKHLVAGGSAVLLAALVLCGLFYNSSSQNEQNKPEEKNTLYQENVRRPSDLEIITDEEDESDDEGLSPSHKDQRTTPKVLSKLWRRGERTLSTDSSFSEPETPDNQTIFFHKKPNTFPQISNPSSIQTEGAVVVDDKLSQQSSEIVVAPSSVPLPPGQSDKQPTDNEELDEDEEEQAEDLSDAEQEHRMQVIQAISDPQKTPQQRANIYFNNDSRLRIAILRMLYYIKDFDTFRLLVYAFEKDRYQDSKKKKLIQRIETIPADEAQKLFEGLGRASCKSIQKEAVAIFLKLPTTIENVILRSVYLPAASGDMGAASRKRRKASFIRLLEALNKYPHVEEILKKKKDFNLLVKELATLIRTFGLSKEAVGSKFNKLFPS